MACAGMLASGCVPPAEPPGPVTVRLVNTSGFVVDANVYLSSASVSTAELFAKANLYTAWKGERLFPILEPKESVSFSIECDQIARIGVSEPVFTSVVTGLGTRSEDQIALQRPSTFDCEQTVTFTYSANAAEARYEVTSSVQ